MDVISVIIPVYKVEKYLRQCVDSVLAQTYTNLEVILVDDGSPDDCGAICDEYAKKDCRIKVIHKENGGVSSARNAGLSVATGQYIAFVDADDYIDFDMYERLHEIIVSERADVIECNYRRNDQCNSGTDKYHVHSGKDAIRKMLLENCYPNGFSVSPCDKLFSIKVTEGVYFLEKCRMAEDMLFVCEVFLRCDRIIKLDRRMYTYRITAGSATNTEYSLHKADEVDAAEGIMQCLDGSGEMDLQTLGRSRFADLSIAHWLRCHERREDKVYQEKAMAIRTRYLQYDCKIRKNYTMRMKIKTMLFKLCPEILAKNK